MSDYTVTKNLVRLIQLKRELLGRIYELVQRQHRCVEKQEISRIMPVLSAKQQLIDHLQQVERELDPYRNDDPEARLWERPQDRQACADQAAENKKILAQILALEKNCEEELVAQRASTVEQLHANRTAREALQAYRPQVSGAGGRLDLSSE